MPKKKNTKKRLNDFLKVCRWVHVYCSTLLFTLLVFFSITGIFLNHRWYYQDGNNTSIEEFELTPQQMSEWQVLPGSDWQPDITSITTYLNDGHGLSSPSSIDIDAELGELVIEYKVPAGFASITIDAFTHRAYLEKEAGSSVGILNDLHKGRYSGATWAWVIDISAGLICLFSITGIIILFQGKKYKKAGVLSALAGLLTPIFVYLVFVPAISA